VAPHCLLLLCRVHTTLFTLTHTLTHTYTHSHAHTLMHTRTQIHIYTHKHTHHSCSRGSTHIHTHTHTLTHTHTHKHTHTHTHTHVKTCTWCLLRGLHNILRTTCGRNTNSKIVHRHLLHKNTYQTPVVLYTTCRICRVLGPPTIQHWPELPYHFWWKDCAATVCSNSKTE